MYQSDGGAWRKAEEIARGWEKLGQSITGLGNKQTGRQTDRQKSTLLRQMTQAS